VKQLLLSVILFITLVITGCSNQKQTTGYPRIFRAWSGIEDTIFKGDEIGNYARHDLCFGSISAFLGLEWQLDDSNKYEALSTKISQENMNAATNRKAQLLKLNPDILLLAVIDYRDLYYGSGVASSSNPVSMTIGT
jgi:hypothetical protein